MRRAVVDAPAWQLVVPVKELYGAKSRLAGPSMTALERAELALAFALDTVETALSCSLVRSVVVVTGDEAAAAALRDTGVEIVPDPDRGGLNAAIVAAVAAVPAGQPVGVLLADLPALDARVLGTALRRAGRHRLAFVADASGHGTTLLTAISRQLLRPSFGHGSAAAHEALGARRICGNGLERLRRDVDVEADLWTVAAMGVGRHTAAVLADLHEALPIGLRGLPARMADELAGLR